MVRGFEITATHMYKGIYNREGGRVSNSIVVLCYRGHGTLDSTNN